jgi:hypothetical protein
MKSLGGIVQLVNDRTKREGVRSLVSVLQELRSAVESAEAKLGNPPVNGYILSSSIVGKREWVAPSSVGSAEPALGTPAGNGYLLSSTTAGVRSWVDPTSIGGGGGGADILEVQVFM